jgi:hypothetical protein
MCQNLKFLTAEKIIKKNISAPLKNISAPLKGGAPHLKKKDPSYFIHL